MSDFSELGALCEGKEYVASSIATEETLAGNEINKTISSYGV